MSCLRVYNETGVPAGEIIREHTAISAQLRPLGVRFEHWQANCPLRSDSPQEEVLAVYAEQIQSLREEYGFKSVDVVSLRPDNPKCDELREKFLMEHTHNDFEVRFFVEGSGLFYLHMGNKVYLLLCGQGDLISVPANVTHWFDMGSKPDFKCIRLFVVPDGWQANFTKSAIERNFPDFDRFMSKI